MKEEKLIDLLDNPKTRLEGLDKARNLSSISDEIIDKLLECALKENDPSFNGQYVKLCVKNRDVFKIGMKLMIKATRGSDLEKIGALKALYHVQEEPLLWDSEANQFEENPRMKDHFQAYSERKKILTQEYKKCNNIVFKFWYQWAIPSERGKSIIGVPETEVELYHMINDTPELKELVKKYREWE